MAFKLSPPVCSGSRRVEPAGKRRVISWTGNKSKRDFGEGWGERRGESGCMYVSERESNKMKDLKSQQSLA